MWIDIVHALICIIYGAMIVTALCGIGITIFLYVKVK